MGKIEMFFFGFNLILSPGLFFKGHGSKTFWMVIRSLSESKKNSTTSGKVNADWQILLLKGKAVSLWPRAASSKGIVRSEEGWHRTHNPLEAGSWERSPGKESSGTKGRRSSRVPVLTTPVMRGFEGLLKLNLFFKAHMRALPLHLLHNRNR